MIGRLLSRLASLAPATAVTLALGAHAGTAVADDEATFKARCGRCHTAAEAARLTVSAGPAEKRSAWLADFLRTHHARDDADRAAIARFVEGQIAGSEKTR